MCRRALRHRASRIRLAALTFATITWSMDKRARENSSAEEPRVFCFAIVIRIGVCRGWAGLAIPFRKSETKYIEEMVRPERFELPAFWFVARRSIQLSYGRTRT